MVAMLLFSLQGFAQQIPIYKADDLVARISNDDTLYIVNFWATWCAPCIKELPELDALHDYYKNKPVKVLLISLDFKNDYQKKLPRFLNKRKLKPEVIWLNESKPNDFIPKIAPEWQGSIPATLLVYPQNQYRNFFEGSITAAQIRLLADKQLAQ